MKYSMLIFNFSLHCFNFAALSSGYQQISSKTQYIEAVAANLFSYTQKGNTDTEYRIE